MTELPDANEPGPYGIGSNHWPGMGKVMEEMNELGVVLGKLIGSNGSRVHWSGDLDQMIRCEIADVRAALDFFEAKNPELGGRLLDDFNLMRRRWKLDLFHAWHDGLPESEWPRPEEYGLPSRELQSGERK